MYDTIQLEFNKIIEKLKKYTKTNYAKEKLNELKPIFDYDNIILEKEKTKEAYDAIVRYSDIPLGGLVEVKKAINRSKIGGVLNPNELIDIVNFIDFKNNVSKY